MKKSTLFALAATGAVVAGASYAAYKLMKKHLKFTVEVLPDNIEDPNELTAAVDVVDIDTDEDTDSEIEVSLTEEDN